MDELFKNLNENILELIHLSLNAENNLTEESQKTKEPPYNILNGWHKFTNGIQHCYPKLNRVINCPADKISMNDLDHCLGPFRTLSRHFSEVGCDWSTSYDDIHKSMVKVGDIVEEIDYKYTLGNVKIRKEQNEKNNQSES